MSKQSMSDYMFNQLRSQVVAYKSSSSILKAVIYLLVGVAGLVALYAAGLDTASALYYIIMFAAVIGLVGAVFHFFFGGKAYKLASTGSAVTSMVYYFNAGTAAQLSDALVQRDWSKIASFERQMDGGTRLELAYSADGTKSLAMVLTYASYEFQPYGQAVSLTGDEMQQLLAALK